MEACLSVAVQYPLSFLFFFFVLGAILLFVEELFNDDMKFQIVTLKEIHLNIIDFLVISEKRITVYHNKFSLVK